MWQMSRWQARSLAECCECKSVLQSNSRWSSPQLQLSYVTLQTCITHVRVKTRCVCAWKASMCSLPTTDLQRCIWVMMYTFSFHQMSLHGTWNPQNYISLAISCKIFTYSVFWLDFFFHFCVQAPKATSTLLFVTPLLRPEGAGTRGNSSGKQSVKEWEHVKALFQTWSTTSFSMACLVSVEKRATEVPQRVFCSVPVWKDTRIGSMRWSEFLLRNANWLHSLKQYKVLFL